VLGDPENPLSPDQVQAKAMLLLEASGCTELQAQQLINTVLTLPGGDAPARWWNCLPTWPQSQKVSSAQANDNKPSS
jgi:hypothetical protein